MLKSWSRRLQLGAGYQSYKVLQRFTPSERARLITFVQRKHLASLLATSFLVAAGVASWVMLVINLWTSQIKPAVNFNAWVVNDPAKAIALCAALFVLLLVGPLTGLMVRDRWLKWALSRHVSQSHCHECQYPFLDIPVERERLTCPECGECAVVVPARGMVPARMLEVR